MELPVSFLPFPLCLLNDPSFKMSLHSRYKIQLPSSVECFTSGQVTLEMRASSHRIFCPPSLSLCLSLCLCLSVSVSLFLSYFLPTSERFLAPFLMMAPRFLLVFGPDSIKRPPLNIPFESEEMGGDTVRDVLAFP